jgi:hypothetical protein
VVIQSPKLADIGLMSTVRTILKTAIERELHSFIQRVKEHTRDFSVLYVRRSKAPVEPEQMRVMLDIVDLAIMDGFQKHVDKFMNEVERRLDAAGQ